MSEGPFDLRCPLLKTMHHVFFAHPLKYLDEFIARQSYSSTSCSLLANLRSIFPNYAYILDLLRLVISIFTVALPLTVSFLRFGCQLWPNLALFVV